MIQIEDTIVSFDIFVKKFCCDLAQCRGICCVEGDSGAPLEEDEPVGSRRTMKISGLI